MSFWKIRNANKVDGLAYCALLSQIYMCVCVKTVNQIVLICVIENEMDDLKAQLTSSHEKD